MRNKKERIIRGIKNEEGSMWKYHTVIDRTNKRAKVFMEDRKMKEKKKI